MKSNDVQPVSVVKQPSDTVQLAQVAPIRLPKVKAGIKAGPNRRKFDHIG